MKVALIIVNFNGGDDLQRCLHKVKAQSRLPDRCIVIDNLSLEYPLKGDEPWFQGIEFIQNPFNMGFAAANNLGAQRVLEADWLVFLNPDAFPEPNWLQSLEEASKAHPSTASFTSRQISFENPETLDGMGDSLSLAGRPFRRGFGRKVHSGHPMMEPVFSGCGAAMMVKRDLFMELGGFDDDFFCYLEDIDLGFRLNLLGHHCLYVEEATVFHRGSGTTGFRSEFSTYHGHRNMLWVFIKNMPTALLPLTIPMHLIITLLAFFQCLRRGQGRLFLKSKWDALKGLPMMLKKRSDIQRSRKATLLELLRAFRSQPKKGLSFVIF